MEAPVVIVGLGQMGGVFARGFLRAAHPVYPVSRQMDVSAVAAKVPDPELVLVTVGEADLDKVLEGLPNQWRDRVGLLQNELMPRVWQAHGLKDPTVLAAWFEKKRSTGVHVTLPSPVHGPRADLVCRALSAVDIACKKVATADEMLLELVMKNLYILTINIAGLLTGGTVGELWDMYPQLTEEVARQILDIQRFLSGRPLPHGQLLDGLVSAFEARSDQSCTGRSASGRLARAILHADEAGLAVPRLREIQAQIS